jgi:hypothetical protein
MGYPSKHVAIEEGVPGVLIRIAGKAPPYMAEQYTALTHISPITGSIAKVNGTNIATAIVAVNPGRAPAIMPSGMSKVMAARFLKARTLINASKNIPIVQITPPRSTGHF